MIRRALQPGRISMTTGSPLEFSDSMTAPIIYLRALHTPGETNTITVDSGVTITSYQHIGYSTCMSLPAMMWCSKPASHLVSATGVQILAGNNITVEASAHVNASGNILTQGR